MPPPAKESSKAQPMSISQLCQQYDSEDELHHMKQDLEQDPLDLDSGNESDTTYMNSRRYHHTNSSQTSYTSEAKYYDDYDSSARTAAGQPDDDEQLAAEALGDMANATRSNDPNVASSASTSSFLIPTGPFISRMSSLPLVNSALKAYETGKQNSKVMKYGAEMVESSVKSLSKPVFEKLEPKLGQLDDFACRQLDKFEKVYPKNDAQAFPSPTDSGRSSNDLLRPDAGSNGYFAHRSRGDSIDSTSTSSSRPSFDVLRSRNPRHEDATMRQRSDSNSSQRSAYQYATGPNGHYNYSQHQTHHQVGSLAAGGPSQQPFSGWRGVVATVGSASAAGVAVFSEESMKSLKYCLQWLQYAVQHIDYQIGLLRAFLASLASPSQSTTIVPSTAASTLASIKKEVVETLRKVINVVSKYAGACLPDHAKINVRQFILSMPVRWATLNNESVPSTPIGSPSMGPVDRHPDHIAALNDTSERANRVLVLANESSDMLKSVSTIFKDSVDKAESWMDKLRYVGMNPQNNSEGLPSWAPTGFPGAPGGGMTMPGGFPGASLEQYSLRQSQPSQQSLSPSSKGSPTRSLKSSPRLGSRDKLSHFPHNRHSYRQKSIVSDNESDVSENENPMQDDDDEDDGTLVMEDDSDDESLRLHDHGPHGPIKRSMTSSTLTQGNAVRRRKKRGESAEVVAGLGLAHGQPM